ncbi:MAG: lipoyl synthase [Acidimicrobiales bacterium]|nr:lipoyl synthase [Acidimicrobiales bacterium]MYG89796.1 lipoyl synthase [Acidimicrobiales bacterium]MYI27157.1 lipoyl synthase [Acidimicrobiales bacterium]
MHSVLQVRWLGRVGFREALDLQRRLWAHSADNYLLLLEHHHVFTAGPSADEANLLVDPGEVGADCVRIDRGGDFTYHGPGQLVGYPILTLPGRRGGGLAETAVYVCDLEQVLIDALADLGLPGCGRLRGYPGVWLDLNGTPRKLAAVGVRLSRGRTMHGFALNVDTDLSWFERIIPCGIRDFEPTSLRAEGCAATMREVTDAVVGRAAEQWGEAGCERADVAWRHRPSDLSAFSRGLCPGRVEVAPPRSRARLAEAGVENGLGLAERKPSWLRARMDLNEGYLRLRQVMRQHDLVTVCEEAGCPNIFECWGAGTATFMLNGERCTRACGFCLVDTRQPAPLDPGEPHRVADAVAEMELDHAVVTAVARDDLPDGGAAAFAETIDAIRAQSPDTTVEVLVPDFGGAAASLHTVLDAAPDIVNHNIETVARLQRAVRPSAGYARSLALLARSATAGHVTKSGIIVGMGEEDAEIDVAMADLAAVGVSIVTIGQYLRPTSHHIPVARWVPPESFKRWREVGAALGIDHVESSPLTRSSYHAAESAAAVELGARTRPIGA